MEATHVTIRDVPTDALDILKERAAQEGVSLSRFLRELIEREAATPTMAEAIERIRAHATAEFTNDDVLDAIEAGRERRT
ncbi:FitA-like ribbon-helix-helix domain-containing protein [Streptomyces boninensis]|uniref:FitA-like ribbon-helix-helix domain-containing protein n=1 Tax=Streptomyces boninensis TaxID=2039455 RepID=UPI003B215518